MIMIIMLEMLNDGGDHEKFGDDCGANDAGDDNDDGGGDVNDDGGDDEKN